MRKLILSILAMLSLMVSTACGQAGKDRLTAKTLQKATRIQYYTDNGTVAPDHHFGVTVTVSRDSVCLTVTKGYKQQVIYSQTAPLTPAHYEQFIKQLAELVIELTGSKSQIVYQPAAQDDPQQRQPIIDKAKAILDWQPTVQLREGLEKTIEYFSEIL